MTFNTGEHNSQAYGTEKPGEFYCPECGLRCTRSQSGKDVEYGHGPDCSRRPDYLPANNSGSRGRADD